MIFFPSSFLRHLANHATFFFPYMLYRYIHIYTRYYFYDIIMRTFCIWISETAWLRKVFFSGFNTIYCLIIIKVLLLTDADTENHTFFLMINVLKVFMNKCLAHLKKIFFIFRFFHFQNLKTSKHSLIVRRQ